MKKSDVNCIRAYVIRALIFVFTFNQLTFPVYAEENIVVDRETRPDKNTTVSKSENGADVINISTPSKGGVSKNFYNKFNVGENGAIFNNQISGGKSQIGGYVDGNEHIRNRSARVILNEVTSKGEESLIQGEMEVFGDKATVIISNPHGFRIRNWGLHNFEEFRTFDNNSNDYDDFVSDIIPNNDEEDVFVREKEFSDKRVRVVFISESSKGGVSKNTFDEFNVDKNGVVINNSAKDGVSILAGELTENENLKGKEADIVLFEVSGAKKSALVGDMEMFGKRGTFILANEYGILVNGTEFINMDAITLSTGEISYDNAGEYRHMIVQQGAVEIGSGGVDASDANYFDVLARNIKVQGLVLGAYDTRFLTGEYVVDVKENEITPFETAKPEDIVYAIDARDLGSMYSGTIRFISTEDGVGVNSGGSLIALNEGIEISAAGDIVYKNAVAKTDFVANNSDSKGSIAQNGAVFAGRNVMVSAGETVTVKGNVSAGGDVVVAAQDGDVNVQGNEEAAVVVLAQNVLVQAAGNVALSKAEVAAQDTALFEAREKSLSVADSSIIAGTVQEKANAEINHSNSVFESTQGRIFQLANTLTNVDSIVFSAEDIMILADGTVTNQNSLMDGVDVSITAGNFIQKDNSVVNGLDSVAIRAVEDIFQNKGSKIDSLGLVAIDAGRLFNDGEIRSVLGTVISADKRRKYRWGWDLRGMNDVGIYNTGLIDSLSAVEMTAKYEIKNTGEINAKSIAKLDAHKIKNDTDGKIKSDTLISLQSTNTLTNDGDISSFGDIYLKSINDEVDNNGLVVAFGKLNGDGDVENSGTMVGNEGVSITGLNDFENSGTVMSNAKLSIVVNDAINNDGGTLLGWEIMAKGDDVLNDKNGVIKSTNGDVVLLAGKSLRNKSGTVLAAKDLRILAPEILLNSGISALGNLEVKSEKTAVTIDDSFKDKYKFAGDFTGKFKSVVVNKEFESDGVLALSAVDYLTNNAKLTAGTLLDLSSAAELVNNGYLVSQGDLLMSAGGDLYLNGDGERVSVAGNADISSEANLSIFGAIDPESGKRFLGSGGHRHGWKYGYLYVDYELKQDVNIAGDLTLASGGEMTLDAVDILVGNNLNVNSGNDFNVYSEKDRLNYQWHAVYNLHHLMTNDNYYYKYPSKIWVDGSAVINSGGDINLKTVDFQVEKDLIVDAEKSLNLYSELSGAVLYTGEKEYQYILKDLDVLKSVVQVNGNANFKLGENLRLDVGELIVQGDAHIDTGKDVILSWDSGAKVDIDNTRKYKSFYEMYFPVASLIRLEGDAFINAGQDVSVDGSAVEVGGSMVMKAGQDVLFKDALTTRHTGSEDWSGRSKHNEHDNYEDRKGSETEIGGEMTVISAGRNFVNNGSVIESSGITSIEAGNDILLSSVKNSRNYSYWGRKTKGTFGSDTDKTGSGLTTEGTVPAGFIVNSNVDVETGPKGYAMVQLENGNLEAVKIVDVDENKNAILDPNFIASLENTAKDKDAETARFQIIDYVDASQDLLMTAKNNIGLQGSNINVAGSGVLKADNEINIVNATEQHSSNYWVDKDSWGGLDNTKRSGDNNFEKNVVSRVVMSGDIDIHADNKVLIQGSEVSAGDDIDIFGKNDVQILSAEEFSQTIARKSNNHVIAGKDELWIQSSLKHIGSNINSAGGNITVRSDGGITIEASTIDAGDSVELDAKDIVIRAKKDIHKTAYKKSTHALNMGTLLKAAIAGAVGANGESIMDGINLGDYSRDEEIVQSLIKAQKNITICAENGVLIEGSLIETINGDLVIDAKSLVVKTVEENDSRSSSREEWSMGKFGIETTRSSIGFSSEISSEQEREAQSFDKHQESVLKAGGAVTMIGKDQVMVLGSNVLAGGDINIMGKDVSILSVKEVEEMMNARDKTSAKVTMVVGNAWAETAFQAEDAYDTVQESQKAVDDLGSDESEINHAARILQAVFATAQVARVVEAAAESVKTAGSYGFYAASQQKVQTESEKNESRVESSQASFIQSTLGDINITADNNVIVMGSHIKTDTGDINVDGENVIFNGDYDESSQTNSYEQHTAQSSTGIGNGTFSRDESGRKMTSGRYMGASVDAAGNLNITARSNIDVIGSTLTGENVDLEALNGTVTVQTMQDYMDDVAESKGISVGQQNGFYVSQDKTRYKWTNQQASIVGRNKVEIKADRLVLEGAKIANEDAEGNDKGNLIVNARSVIEKELKDSYEQSHEAFSFGFNKNQKGNEGTQKTKSGAQNPADPLDGNITAGYSQNKHEKEQVVRSTIGNGEIITDSDITNLNRDTAKAMEVIKDKRSGGLDLQVNLPTRYIFGGERIKEDEDGNKLRNPDGSFQTEKTNGLQEVGSDLAAIPKLIYTKENGVGGNLKGAGENVGKAVNNLRKAVVDNISGKSKETLKEEYQANLRNQELGLQAKIDDEYIEAVKEMAASKENLEVAKSQIEKLANKAVALDGIDGDVNVEFYYAADGYAGGHKDGTVLINLYYSDGSEKYINTVLGDELSHYVDYKTGKNYDEHRQAVSTKRGDDAEAQFEGYNHSGNVDLKSYVSFHQSIQDIDFLESNEWVTNTDGIERRAIYIPGTDLTGKGQVVDPELIAAISQTFDENTEVFYWSGENNKRARTAAAKQLLESINNTDFEEDEKFIFVEHSHGGNVLKEFTQLYNGDKKIDINVFLGTPHRDDYELDLNAFNNDNLIINLYDEGDMVQKLGGGTNGLAQRELKNAINIAIYQTETVQRNIGGTEVDDIFPPMTIDVQSHIGPVKSHVTLNSKEIWEKYIDKSIDRHDSFIQSK